MSVVVNHERLAEILIAFSRTLVTEYDVTEMLTQVCEHTAEILPVSGAGVMLEDELGNLRFVAASDVVVRAIEDLQIEFGEGPCLYAYQTGESIVVADLAAGEWFPKFTPRALEAGLRAVSSFPMRVPHGTSHATIGALNLYRSEPADFDEGDRVAAQALTDVATAYIVNARTHAQSTRLTEQLQQALSSRIIIEQAKGRLAEQLGVEVNDAFSRLRKYARDRGLKLHVVARAVVDGQLRLDSAAARRD